MLGAWRLKSDEGFVVGEAKRPKVLNFVVWLTKELFSSSKQLPKQTFFLLILKMKLLSEGIKLKYFRLFRLGSVELPVGRILFCPPSYFPSVLSSFRTAKVL